MSPPIATTIRGVKLLAAPVLKIVATLEKKGDKIAGKKSFIA